MESLYISAFENMITSLEADPDIYDPFCFRICVPSVFLPMLFPSSLSFVFPYSFSTHITSCMNINCNTSPNTGGMCSFYTKTNIQNNRNLIFAWKEFQSNIISVDFVYFFIYFSIGKYKLQVKQISFGQIMPLAGWWRQNFYNNIF